MNLAYYGWISEYGTCKRVTGSLVWQQMFFSFFSEDRPNERTLLRSRSLNVPRLYYVNRLQAHRRHLFPSCVRKQPRKEREVQKASISQSSGREIATERKSLVHKRFEIKKIACNKETSEWWLKKTAEIRWKITADWNQPRVSTDTH